MDFYHALQCRAMLAVVKPDREAWLRYVLRWYSKNFHTPLQQVGQLPLDDVLVAYYEEKFEEMEPDDREDHLLKLLETDEERAAREQAEEAAEHAGDAMFDLLNQQVKADVDKGKLPATKFEPKKRLRLGQTKKRPDRLGALKAAAKVAEEVVSEMKFDDDGNLSSSDPLAALRKKS